MMPRFVDLERVARLIARFEGFRAYVYDDATWPSRAVSPAECYRQGGQYHVRRTGGVATIGYGETDADYLEAKWATGTTEAGEWPRYRTRVAEFADAVEAMLTHTPSAHQAEAMTSLAYNIGLGGFRDSTVRRRFNAGDLRGAADAFLMWVTPAALRARREIEIAHFLTPDTDAPPPPPAPVDVWADLFVPVLVEA